MAVNKSRRTILRWVLPVAIILALILSLSGSSVIYYALGFAENIQEMIFDRVISLFDDNEGNGDNDNGDPVPGWTSGDSVLSAGDLYCYNQLNDDEKKVYEKIASAVENHKDVVHNLRIEDSEVLFKILNYVGMDHPEYFWWETRGSVGVGTLAGRIVDVSISFDYAMTEAEAQDYKQKIDNVVNTFLSSVDDTASEYDKLLSVYDYIIDNVTYNKSAPNNQNIVSALIGKESVCSGYSKSMQYLLNRLGVFSTNVVGEANGIGAHTWNLVAIDGAYYYVDVTWGDPIFSETIPQLTIRAMTISASLQRRS
jgi:hypothetical protein